jgi:arginine deiminase
MQMYQYSLNILRAKRSIACADVRSDIPMAKASLDRINSSPDVPVWLDRNSPFNIEGGDELILSKEALAIGISVCDVLSNTFC